MKRLALTVSVFFSLLVGLAVAPTYAQSMDRITAKIPFDFIAGNQTFPAGEYTFGRGLPQAPNLLLIRSADHQLSLFLNVIGEQAEQMPTETDLVFNKVGDEYFLSQLWITGEDLGREVPKPRAERELERSELGQTASVVTVRLGASAHPAS